MQYETKTKAVSGGHLIQFRISQSNKKLKMHLIIYGTKERSQELYNYTIYSHYLLKYGKGEGK